MKDRKRKIAARASRLKLSATYGKNGLPELPAIPEEVPTPVVVLVCFPCVHVPKSEPERREVPRFLSRFIGQA